MRVFVSVLIVSLLLAFAGFGAARFIKKVQFERNVAGHLKRASDASTIELAAQELEIAVSFLDAHNLTHGYTSLLYQTPNEDVGFWYDNLSRSLNELKELEIDLKELDLEKAHLTSSNQLMKLRETLLDDTDKGVEVTAPKGISIYPNNWSFCLWGIISGAPMAIAFVVLWARA